jgi:hypothetical protein
MSGIELEGFCRQSLGVCAFTIMLATTALGQDSDAKKILKTMSDYVGSQKSVMVTFDTDIEVVTMNYQKNSVCQLWQDLAQPPRQAQV